MTIKAMNVIRLSATNFLPFDKVPPSVVARRRLARPDAELTKGHEQVRDRNVTGLLTNLPVSQQEGYHFAPNAVIDARDARSHRRGRREQRPFHDDREAD